MKAFVAIDVQNLWYGAREGFGRNYRVNFRNLQRAIIDILPDGCEVQAIAYVIESPRHDNSKFIAMLDSLDFETKVSHLCYESSGNGTAVKSDWDLGIAVDAMNHAYSGTDIFVLVSGKGDYSYLCKTLKDLGQTRYILTFEHSKSNKLDRLADTVHLLDKSNVYDTKAD